MLSERRSGLSESLWRAGFGVWLCAEFARAYWPAEGALRPLGTLGIVGGACIALGWHERIAALALACAWCLRPFGPDLWRGEWAVVPLLVAQALVLPAPYGSLAARGRADPAGGWRMTELPLRLRFATLFSFAPCLCFPGGAFEPDAVHALRADELGPWLAGAGLAAALSSFLVRERALGWAWLAFLAAAIATQAEPGKEGMHAYLWLALAATVQPGWIPPREERGMATVYYDGTCALCHGFVRFVLSEDARGERFRFAPLQGAGFVGMPDSIVLRSAQGELLVRSRAVLYVLERLGGFHRALAWCGGLLSTELLDAGYSLVARFRKRIFGTKDQACPLLPRHLRARFDL